MSNDNDFLQKKNKQLWFYRGSLAWYPLVSAGKRHINVTPENREGKMCFCRNQPYRELYLPPKTSYDLFSKLSSNFKLPASTRFVLMQKIVDLTEISKYRYSQFYFSIDS